MSACRVRGRALECVCVSARVPPPAPPMAARRHGRACVYARVPTTVLCVRVCVNRRRRRRRQRASEKASELVVERARLAVERENERVVREIEWARDRACVCACV